jgi:hypothetical protein
MRSVECFCFRRQVEHGKEAEEQFEESWRAKSGTQTRRQARNETGSTAKRQQAIHEDCHEAGGQEAGTQGGQTGSAEGGCAETRAETGSGETGSASASARIGTDESRIRQPDHAGVQPLTAVSA